MIRTLCLMSVLTLTACATTIAEESGTITLYGNTYRTVTHTFQAGDGSTYQRMTVYVGNERITCIPGDVRDCEVEMIEERDRGF